jgi:glucose/arabinose dehydrogenase
MRKSIIISAALVAVFIVLAAVLFLSFIQPAIKPSVRTNVSLSEITLPQGFVIEVFADDLGESSISTPGPNPGARFMMIKDGTLFVTITNEGRVVALQDTDNDGKSDSTTTIIEGLNRPHGIDFSENWFYIAEENRVIRVQDTNGDLVLEDETIENLVDLPSGEGHFTRTVKIHNNSMYISIGSSCNTCIEEDDRRSKILICDVDGTGCTTFASGLRNAVGFVFHPETGEMYATENGRDFLGDDLPPDEINVIQSGRDYGWPICYGKNIHDTNFDKNVYIQDPCTDKVPSLVDLQAHSAPLGLAFYDGSNFPEEYRGDLFVAYHGSWNRNEPTGYKIVRIDMGTLQVSDFATGWLQNGNVIGRPVDIVVADDGSMLVSDDNAGKIYRIYYAG